MESKPNIHIIATGGTIAMRQDPVTGGAIPAVSGKDLVAAVPGVDRVANLTVEEFANIPSERMKPEIWLRLAGRVRDQAGLVDGIVIPHGTDTMEETAFYLDVTVDTATPIVLTGAQRSASDPDPDGPRNLRDAIVVASHAGSRGRGVMIVMDGEIHSARTATKANTQDLDAFDTTIPPDLGWVRKGQINFTGEWAARIHVPFPTSAPRVDIIPMYAGADDAALKAAISRGAAGLVIEGVGAGNVNEELYQGILDALQDGAPVVISSRVLRGGVWPIYGYAGGGVSLVEAGAILSHDLSPQKSRALLIAALGAGLSGEALRELFETPAPVRPA
ncbi:MAG: asparaginase [Anaerolineales bacterium]|nr:asparaginase [Anaerolineales bacterium]